MSTGLPAHAVRAANQPARVVVDSGDTHHTDPVIITADRISSPVSSATSAVARIDRETLRSYPIKTLGDAIEHALGFTMVDFEGTGNDPQAIVRGFYGGGEADYLVVLMDGRPINAPENGRIAWNLIPMSTIESIEIVRGGASAAWGDAALGGVINVRTKQVPGRSVRGNFDVGSFNMRDGSLNLSQLWDGRSISLFGARTQSEGFRAHASNSTGSVGGSLGVLPEGTSSLTLSTLNDWRNFDEPGPVTEAQLATSRTTGSALYRFDHTMDRLHRVNLDGSTLLGSAQFTGFLTGEYRHSDRVRTVPLAPDYASTNEHLLTSARGLGSAQLQFGSLFFNGADNLLLGVDASSGRVTSRYYDYAMGTSADYAVANPARGVLEARGVGVRNVVGGFFRYGVAPASALRLSLGGRIDGLHDRFTPRSPSTDTAVTASHVAFSPKVGVSVRYANSERHEGHLYANIARSFKAPTPDQLFDQRPIPVPFPPYSITFANAKLRPQYGTNTEGGIYDHTVLVPGLVSANLTASVYQLQLRDELDFDLQSFRYQNIGQSRHRGIETGVDVQGPASVSLFTHYTLQSAISQVAENYGKQLKAVPRHVFSAGTSVGSRTGFGASLLMTSSRGIYLDDANTRAMPGWTRWDARVTSVAVRDVQLRADIINLFNSTYNTTGYPDASDPSVIYYYPAAGRAVRFGVSRSW